MATEIFNAIDFRSEVESQKWEELIEILTFTPYGDEIIENFNNTIVFYKRVDFNLCITLLLAEIKKLLLNYTQHYKIAGSTLSKYEEECILQKFLFDKFFKTLPTWFKDRY